jgi:hypothetical protein
LTVHFTLHFVFGAAVVAAQHHNIRDNPFTSALSITTCGLAEGIGSRRQRTGSETVLSDASSR